MKVKKRKGERKDESKLERKKKDGEERNNKEERRKAQTKKEGKGKKHMKNLTSPLQEPRNSIKLIPRQRR